MQDIEELVVIPLKAAHLTLQSHPVHSADVGSQIVHAPQRYTGSTSMIPSPGLSNTLKGNKI